MKCKFSDTFHLSSHLVCTGNCSKVIKFDELMISEKKPQLLASALNVFYYRAKRYL